MGVLLLFITNNKSFSALGIRKFDDEITTRSGGFSLNGSKLHLKYLAVLENEGVDDDDVDNNDDAQHDDAVDDYDTANDFNMVNEDDAFDVSDDVIDKEADPQVFPGSCVSGIVVFNGRVAINILVTINFVVVIHGLLMTTLPSMMVTQLIRNCAAIGLARDIALPLFAVIRQTIF